ncbi:MAG: pirin family protein [Pseudomonadota bacterium]
MSRLESEEPECAADVPFELAALIVPRARDIGGFDVRRVLPSAQRQMVGPFIFFDQMGPAEFLTGQGVDVRPHPHIGLSTLTYLFDGEIIHRDSLGVTQAIRPGAANLMTAGRGVTHSERTAPEVKASGSNLFGAQMWLALPKTHEDGDAAFIHHAEEELPTIAGDGLKGRVIAGTAFGAASPLEFPWDTLCVDLAIDAGAVAPVDTTVEDRAIYILSGAIEIGGDRHEAGRLLVLREGDALAIRAVDGPARVMLLGGAVMDGPRRIWWNFVASDPERIEQAKADWRAGRFAMVPGDDEFIPLPEK